jgi:dihydrofolate reductase
MNIIYDGKVKLIVAICNGGGIGINNTLPWKIKDDLRYFSVMTSGDYGKYMKDTEKYISTGKPASNICIDDLNIKKNAIIMGRNTWLSLPNHPKPLPHRDSIILSRTIVENTKVDTYKNHGLTNNVYSDLNLHFTSISRAMRFCRIGSYDEPTMLEGMTHAFTVEERDERDERDEREIIINSTNSKYKDIWIIGGAKIYESFMNTDIATLIDEIYITYIEREYQCDTFFPFIENMNQYYVSSLEPKMCKCEDVSGISDVMCYYMIFKRLKGCDVNDVNDVNDKIIRVPINNGNNGNNGNDIYNPKYINIKTTIATKENIDTLNKLVISINNTT